MIIDGGISFRNAFDTVPLCAPGQASYLTGRCVNNRIVHVQVTVDTCGYLIPGVGEWYVDRLDSKTSQPKSATPGERRKTTACGKFLK